MPSLFLNPWRPAVHLLGRDEPLPPQAPWLLRLPSRAPQRPCSPLFLALSLHLPGCARASLFGCRRAQPGFQRPFVLSFSLFASMCKHLRARIP
jgi:hypothetical protein